MTRIGIPAGVILTPTTDSGTGTRTPRLVVASVPSGHAYVRHLGHEDGSGPTRLPDPDPDDAARAPTQRWWPPAMLDPGRVERLGADLFHLHFGFDARTPRQLASLVATLRRDGTPLVFTVHDLRNPHHLSRHEHDDQLDVLVPAADELVTLTDGAAAEIARRWGRTPTVLPHPHVVPFEAMTAARASRAAQPREPFRVGLHLKSLRASMAPEVVLPALVEIVADLPDAVLQVNAHRDVVDPGGVRHDAGLARFLRAHAETGRIDLRLHDYLCDADLWAYLGGLDVSVLPYRFGTHSGWLEACRDLGTSVVAPSCGFYAEQGPVASYGLDEDHFDVGSLASAVRDLHRERPDLSATVEQRRVQRRAVAAGHDRVYRSALAR